MTPRTKRRLRGVRLRCPLRCRILFSAPTRTRTCRPRRGETPRATARPPGRCARLRNARAPLPFPSPRASSRSSTRTSDSPSPFARWRERLREEAENRAPRSGPGHASSHAAGPSGAGGGGARGTADAQRGDQTRKTAPPVAPLPSLTWDQHAVFLQFPPTRRATADDLPRGLAPAMLTELYRRVEREQRRFFAYAARFDVLDVLENGATRPFRDDPNENESRYRRYRRVAGDEKHVVAEARRRARLAEAAFETRPTEPSGTLTRGVAPRRVTAMPSLVALERVAAGRHRETAVWANSLELGADLDLDPARAPASAELETVSLRRGDALAPPGADAGDAVAARAIDAVSSLSPFCFVGKNETRRVGVALDCAMTAAAFACLASHAPDRRGRARGRCRSAWTPSPKPAGRSSVSSTPCRRATSRLWARARARRTGTARFARGSRRSARPRRDWSPGRFGSRLPRRTPEAATALRFFRSPSSRAGALVGGRGG